MKIHSVKIIKGHMVSLEHRLVTMEQSWTDKLMSDGTLEIILNVYTTLKVDSRTLLLLDFKSATNTRISKIVLKRSSTEAVRRYIYIFSVIRACQKYCQRINVYI